MEITHQCRERQQILQAERRAPGGHVDERIDLRDIRPSHR
jgi:hypothetical protein